MTATLRSVFIAHSLRALALMEPTPTSHPISVEPNYASARGMRIFAVRQTLFHRAIE
jgi:hypothetical protein